MRSHAPVLKAQIGLPFDVVHPVSKESGDGPKGDQLKLAEWQQRLRRFEKAGLTVVRFCTRCALCVAAQLFWYWRQKCAGAALARQTLSALFPALEVVGGGAVTCGARRWRRRNWRTMGCIASGP